MKPTNLVKQMLAAFTVAGLFLASTSTAADLGEPALNPNENLRLETGTVNGLLVDRYTWRARPGVRAAPPWCAMGNLLEVPPFSSPIKFETSIASARST